MTENQVRKIVREEVNKAIKDTLTQQSKNTVTAPEPNWSKNEGYWERATKAGLVDGTRPEDNMKRDEVIAVLGRKGLL